ncbi:PPOX class F420-dependent oxidoreductase [Streptacidiphilus jiangxiensis]|uniref:PPOX class probable F420-dependent enzyme n=1 Tax=Streptacidiphilus jiangxiensis TaxID=235985 RepID=A0A1H7RWH6_STRJI|nr:PPOX class F420-dependent oxidoreductase [Streptacidiphilus jiangxiensis]SEL64671.1 PPOX class probable F420-dependent enzyme [Streptacidiphilus jiangxiensis]
MAKQELLDLVAQAKSGAVVTLKRDGRPQLSNVSIIFESDARGGPDAEGGPDGVGGLIRFSTTADRAKVANLRRDARVSLYVTRPDFGGYAVVEGTAELTPVSAAPDDATVDELVEVYRRIAGEHPNWDEYRAAMVADRRLVVRIPVERVYGWGGW